MKYVWLLFLFVALPISAFAQAGWKEYVNRRFGFKMSYPERLVASVDPPNGGGREYHTRDKEFSVFASGESLHGLTLDSFWNDELNQPGAEITYQKKAADWYVVSGVKDETEFYHTLYVKGDQWAALAMHYPHAKAKLYGPWVEEIAKSFMPFLPRDYDRVVK